jgi:hypothetical protein
MNQLNNNNLENLDIKIRGTAQPVDPASIPGFLPKSKKDTNFDNYKVRYQKLDMDKPGDIGELELIETKAVRNQGIYVLSKKEFSFMDKMFILINYLEEIKE